jgi:hypothetical protein
LLGDTEIDCSTAGVIISTVDPLMPLKRPPMVDVPVLTPLARPVLSMVATKGAEEVQATWFERSRVD